MTNSFRERQAGIDAVKYAAELLPEGPLGESLNAASARLEADLARDKKRLETPVVELNLYASESEVRDARRRSAVKHRDRTYLPSVGANDRAVLPVAFLRSALFAVVKSPGVDPLVEKVLPCHGRSTVVQWGLPLKDRDMHVYAACLAQYDGERPLGEWADMSYWQLSEAMGVPYGVNVHRALQEALERLSTVQVLVRAEMKNYSQRYLLQVEFGAGEGSDGAAAGLGRDRVRFCVPEAMAQLYGVNLWTAVSLQALAATDGLSRWLTGFYSTHACEWPLSVEELKRLSGANGSLSAFRKRLASALETLTSDVIPKSARVSGFDFDQQGCVTVRLLRWEKGDQKTSGGR